MVVEHKTTTADISEASDYWERLILDAQVSNYVALTRAAGHTPMGVLYDVIRKFKLPPYKATPVESREYTQAKSKGCPECKKKNPAPLPHVDEKTGLECEDMWSTGDGPQDWTASPTPEQLSENPPSRRILTEPSRLYAGQRTEDETLDEYRQRLREELSAHAESYYRRATIRRLKGEEENASRNVWMIARSIRESVRLNQFPQNTAACKNYGSWCEFWPVCSGKASLDDPTLYRDSGEHEELPQVTAETQTAASEAKRLPIISTSSAQAFLTCPTMYRNRYVLRRRSIGSSLALVVGTIIHAGLEVWWTTPERDKALDLAIAAMAKSAAEYGNAIDAFEMVRMEELMRGYDARWCNEPLRVIGAEIELTAPLINPETGHASKTWQRGGKLDALIHAPEES